MEKHITKLEPKELLEVSGGMEQDKRSTWAKELGPIDNESGKQEKKKSGDTKMPDLQENDTAEEV